MKYRIKAKKAQYFVQVRANWLPFWATITDGYTDIDFAESELLAEMKRVLQIKEAKQKTKRYKKHSVKDLLPRMVGLTDNTLP